MTRKTAPQPLELADGSSTADKERDRSPRSAEALQVAPPVSSRSPTSPRSPFRLAQKKGQATGQPMHIAELVQQAPQDEPQYPPISSAIQPPPDEQALQPQGYGQGPSHAPNRHREHKATKSGFFSSFNKSAKSSDRLNSHQHSDSRSETISRGNDTSQTVSKPALKQTADLLPADNTVLKPITAHPSKSDISLASSADNDINAAGQAAKNKTSKPKPFALLSRTRSIRDQENTNQQESVPTAPAEPDRSYAIPPKTAPIGHDHAFRDMMSSTVRNHSADRAQPREMPAQKHAPHNRDYPRIQPSSLRDNGGSAFFSGLKNSSSKAADMISKGLFGKSGRSASTTEREPIVDDEHYVIKVINLPLVEQTRTTRISKRLETSRDKTEFWMPAFPWRAIDYLNYKGTDVEGLYRVPGSGPQIKKWQRRFDEEHDVDLFAQEDLYDINIIGSMLKAWLRELPDELFPKEAQERVSRECAGAEKVPQMLIDELSNLSPFNYYLLFAITCHLSLLLAHSDKNKMDFRNLCICFQPCMKIDAFCFKFLVCDWRDCWKGCKKETKFIEQEYRLFNEPPPPGFGDVRRLGQESLDNQTVSSSGSSSKRSIQTTETHQRPSKNSPQLNEDSSRIGSPPPKSPSLSVDSEREPVMTPPSRSTDLRPLSPIKPLSPLGF